MYCTVVSMAASAAIAAAAVVSYSRVPEEQQNSFQQ